MLKMGIIGTSMISEWLLSAAAAIDEIAFTHLYSRTEAKGREFLTRVGAEEVLLDCDLERFFSRDFDFVYIASPNSLHCSQAEQALRHGKHVLLEKPFALTSNEAEVLFALARERGLLLLEAISSLTKPNLRRIETALKKLGTPQRGHFSMCQYSSKYADFLQGKVANSLNPKFGGGALYDLGVYPLHIAHHLFGMPQALRCQRYFERNVEMAADVALDYGSWVLTIEVSKREHRPTLNWFERGEERLEFDKISLPEQVRLNSQLLDDTNQSPLKLYEELRHFVDLLQAGAIASPLHSEGQSIAVLRLIEWCQRVADDHHQAIN